MKIYISDKDRTGILISNISIMEAMTQFDGETGTITIMLDKIVVKITLTELDKLLGSVHSSHN